MYKNKFKLGKNWLSCSAPALLRNGSHHQWKNGLVGSKAVERVVVRGLNLLFS